MRKKRFRAAATQTLARLGDIPYNIATSAALVEEAVRQGAELVVLPECMDTGYLFNSPEHCRELAEAVPDGPFVSAMAKLARKHGIYIASGITEWDAAKQRIFNTGIMLGRDGEVAIHYHKQFLATHDQNWFTFGERGCPVVDTDLGRIGLLICFDGRIPEIARAIALQGAEIIVDMANFFAMDQADMWGPARAYENGIWLVAATKAGYERSIYYPGGSMIVDPKGRVVAKMPYDRHGLVVADVFPDQAHDKSIYAGNDKFADRRPTTYGILTKNYKDTPVAKTAHEPLIPANSVAKVAAVQMHVTQGTSADDVLAMVDHTAKLGAKVLVLPEYALIGSWAPTAEEAAKAADNAAADLGKGLADRQALQMRDRAVDRHARERPPVRDHRAHRSRRRRDRPLPQDPSHRRGARLGHRRRQLSGVRDAVRPHRHHGGLRRAVPGDLALPRRRRRRHHPVAGRDARSVRARIDRGAARRRQPDRPGGRQPPRQPLSRRQPGDPADRLRTVGHQRGGAALARDGRGDADVHRPCGLPAEADDPQGRHVREPLDADLFGPHRAAAARGSGGVGMQGGHRCRGARS